MTSQLFSGYRKLDLAEDEVLINIEVPHSQQVSLDHLNHL